jgi:hypothetical protein
MIFSDLPSPADPGSAEGGFAEARAGFAKAGNRFPPRIIGERSDAVLRTAMSGAGFFGIML